MWIVFWTVLSCIGLLVMYHAEYKADIILFTSMFWLCILFLTANLYKG